MKSDKLLVGRNYVSPFKNGSTRKGKSSACLKGVAVLRQRNVSGPLIRVGPGHGGEKGWAPRWVWAPPDRRAHLFSKAHQGLPKRGRFSILNFSMGKNGAKQILRAGPLMVSYATGWDVIA